MNYTKAIIVVPTRDRADIAESAVKSILEQSVSDVLVLISDNSTSEKQRARLAQFSYEMGNEQLRYIAPPDPLPMTRHWDWAMQQALDLDSASHVAFLTDRMMFKPGALAPLIELIAANPHQILSYMHDIVDDFSDPAIVRQYAWTGNLYEVPATRLLELSAQSFMYDSSIPRMLNCLVPRSVLERIRRRFGNIFDSVSPDWNFAYRALEVVESILFHDKAALVHYAQSRSTGQSVHYGVINEALAQFRRDFNNMSLNAGSPFPEIVTVWNGIISEYCKVKNATRSAKFPELDLEKYGQALATGIDAIKDPRHQKQMREFLSVRMSKLREAALSPGSRPTPSPTEKIHQYPAGLEASQIQQFSVNAIEFRNPKEALDYALRNPRSKAVASYHEALIDGRVVPLPKRKSEADCTAGGLR